MLKVLLNTNFNAATRVTVTAIRLETVADTCATSLTVYCYQSDSINAVPISFWLQNALFD